MAKLCQNCESYRGCCYRNIINPCDDWRADGKIKALQVKAKEILNKPMTRREAQFVNSCTTLQSFSAEQENWLMSIARRVA